MLRPNAIPFDTYLGDAISLDAASFAARHAWPMIVIPDPDPAVLSRIRRAETVIDRVPRDATDDVEAAPSAASLDALCLEASPKSGLPSDSISIGRSPAADVILLDDSISRIHALLSWTPATQAMVVTDLGARNGTRINGALLEAEHPTPAESGSVLAFGALVTRLYTPTAFHTWLRDGAPRSGAAPGVWPHR
ncbi:MAG: FHA domain-containing protein [Deltaproteobacteria bacterium]|nr:FHA domain-containing protein [Deltaproteobacteria bacterium]